jgi:yecA family protein
MARPRALDLYALETTIAPLPSARSASEISGYLTALLSAPTYVPQEEWLPGVLGDDYLEYEAADDAVELVFAFYQEIHARLSRGAPLLVPTDLLGLRAWALGYLDAAELDEAWMIDSPAARVADRVAEIIELLSEPPLAEDDEDEHLGDDSDDGTHRAGDSPPDNLLHLSAPHVALVTDELPDDEDEDDGELDYEFDESDSDDDAGELSALELAEIAEELADYARLAHVYWREARGKRAPDAQPLLPSPQPVRVAPQVPRNAPCPCGSGKKFKRCCGVDA